FAITSKDRSGRKRDSVAADSRRNGVGRCGFCLRHDRRIFWQTVIESPSELNRRFVALSKIAPFVALVALLAVLLSAYTRHNAFPFYYHTDEPGKVNQIISGTRTYRHPLL